MNRKSTSFLDLVGDAQPCRSLALMFPPPRDLAYIYLSDTAGVNGFQPGRRASEAARWAPATSSSNEETLIDISDLQTQYTNYKNNLQSLAQKVGEIEQEIEEHKLVTETLQPLPEERKCFRLINGVLVERTVKDVLPALKTNSDGLKQVLDELVKQYKGKQDEMDKWKA